MEAQGHHITPVKTLLTVGACLVTLTIITVIFGYLNFPPPYNVIAALGIAIVKASLVAMFFMNLYWDKRFNALILIVSLIFFCALVGITMLDTMYRNPVIPTFTAAGG